MIPFIIAILLFILDRITKILALRISQKITISSFLALSPTGNYGLSFGLFSGYPSLIFWLTLIICIILVAYSVFLKEKPLLFKIGIGLFIGGAISNLFDRIIYSFVVDFISIGIGNIRWPTFNIADLGIVIGAILIICKKAINEKASPL
ncbi:MAG: signal peptidase II [bacterium]